MKKQNLLIPTIIILAPLLTWAATSTTASRLSGRILLDVEKNGEAWYVFPVDLKRYFLKRPSDALSLMKKLGKGISNKDLEKIPVGLIANGNHDSDQDGLEDNLEVALGTNPNKKDSDSDGYNDKEEILTRNNPLGKAALAIDNSFCAKNAGQIFLQVENAGQAWYLNPLFKTRFFLGSPQDAFDLMKKQGLGITSQNLGQIPQGNVLIDPVIGNNPHPSNPVATGSISLVNPGDALFGAAKAIREGDVNKAKDFFVPEMRNAIEYGVKALSSDSRLLLSNILSGSSLDNKNDTEATYKNKVFFSLKGQDVPIAFTVKKQENGGWLMASL